MARQATLTTLPPELRERIYEYVAHAYPSRRIRNVYSEGGSVLEFKTTTSAMSATCRLVNKEYEAIARRCTTTLEFKATNMVFDSIMDYFRRKVNSQYLAILRKNEAIILVNIVINNQNYQREMADFYPWTFFLISLQLEAAYQSDTQTWMEIHIARPHTEFEEQCVLDSNSSQYVRDNIEEIRKLAGDFDKAVWTAYPKFFKAMQIRYHREWDRRNNGAVVEGNR